MQSLTKNTHLRILIFFFEQNFPNKIDNFMRIFREKYANAYFDLFFEQNGQNTHMRI